MSVFTSPRDGTSPVNVDKIHAALTRLLAVESDEIRAVRNLFKSDESINDIRMLKLLATAAAEGLSSSPSPPSAPCMHAHGIEPEAVDDTYRVYLADGGPNLEFRCIYDSDLPQSEPFYAAGIMITAPPLRVVRIYPHTVLFYAIVDGPYRGVRLCTLAVIKSLGFTPEYPTVNDAYPTCRGFYTAAEAFHYLHEALLIRGLIVPSPREPTTAPSVPVGDPQATDNMFNHADEQPSSLPGPGNAPVLQYHQPEVARYRDIYVERPWQRSL